MSDLISREALKEAIKELYNRPQTKSCSNCKHEDKRLIEEPCKSCYTNYREWEPKGGKEDRPQGEIVIKCKDCNHQKKFWHEDKRMKDKGYWVYNCEFIDDPFVGSPVSGLPDEFCSSAERREPDE